MSKYGDEMIGEEEMRLLHLAYQFSLVHIMDTDILGKMAKELRQLILRKLPDYPIERLQNDTI